MRQWSKARPCTAGYLGQALDDARSVACCAVEVGCGGVKQVETCLLGLQSARKSVSLCSTLLGQEPSAEQASASSRGRQSCAAGEGLKLDNLRGTIGTEQRTGGQFAAEDSIAPVALELRSSSWSAGTKRRSRQLEVPYLACVSFTLCWSAERKSALPVTQEPILGGRLEYWLFAAKAS